MFNRFRSALKPKTKFQRFALMLPTLTPIKPFKHTENKSGTVLGNNKKKTIMNSILPSIQNQISNTVIIKPTTEITSTESTLVKSPSFKEEPKVNLYKNVIEYNLLNQHKENEERKLKQMANNNNTNTKPNIPRPKKIYKVDLNKQVKGMIPKIDDLEEFANEIQRKHKGLFEKLIPLLFKQQQIAFNQNKEFKIPFLLYEDYQYFMNRFFPHKHSIKSMSFADSNMLYPSLIDYSSYVKKFKEYLSYFKQDNFTENAFNFDNAFYLELLNRLTKENKTKVVSINADNKADVNKGNLHEKYNKFINEYNNAFHKKDSQEGDESSGNVNEDNAIRSILKKKGINNDGDKRGNMMMNDNNATADADIDDEDEDDDGVYNKRENKFRKGNNKGKDDQHMMINNDGDEIKLEYSSSDNDEFFELHSKVDSQMSNSYLDNSYIFEKKKNEKENQMKFSLRIMKNIQLDEKKVQSLYDKYFSKMNQKQLQRSFD